MDHRHSKSLDQSLQVSKSCLTDLLKVRPSLNIKIIYKWQTILIFQVNILKSTEETLKSRTFSKSHTPR